MKRTGGTRRKTRHKFQNNIRQRGKIIIRRYLQSFEQDDIVVLKLQLGVQKGMYFRRHHGKHGRIVRPQGECYVVAVPDNTAVKNLVVHPAHLVKA